VALAVLPAMACGGSTGVVCTDEFADDRARPALRQSGDEVHAVVSKAEASVEADYLFGPDSLVLP